MVFLKEINQEHLVETECLNVNLVEYKRIITEKDINIQKDDVMAGQIHKMKMALILVENGD